MLQYLKIKNLALLAEVTLELDAGFTAVTGETGAGKSETNYSTSHQTPLGDEPYQETRSNYMDYARVL